MFASYMLSRSIKTERKSRSFEPFLACFCLYAVLVSEHSFTSTLLLYLT